MRVDTMSRRPLFACLVHRHVCSRRASCRVELASVQGVHLVGSLQKVSVTCLAAVACDHPAALRPTQVHASGIRARLPVLAVLALPAASAPVCLPGVGLGAPEHEHEVPGGEPGPR